MPSRRARSCVVLLYVPELADVKGRSFSIPTKASGILIRCDVKPERACEGVAGDETKEDAGPRHMTI